MKLDQIYHGLTAKNVRELAFKMGVSNGTKMPATWTKNCMAGEDLFSSFLN